MGWGGARQGAGKKKSNPDARPRRDAQPRVVRPAVKIPPKITATVATSDHLHDMARNIATGIDPRAMMEMLPEIEAISKRYATNKYRRPENNPFKFPTFPKAALPPENSQMAMDSALTEAMNFGNAGWLGADAGNGLSGEGLLFLGYSYLAELAQRPEYRVMAETIADDATRKWIDFDVVGDEKTQKEEREKDPKGYDERMADPDARKKRVTDAGKLDRIKALKDDQLRLEVKDRFYEQCRNDGFFGRSHLFLDIHTEGQPDNAELGSPIGNGRDAMSKGKVPQGSFKALRTIEPVWTYPLSYNATDPLRSDWYNPQVWYVMGREIHGSRLLTFIGHPVPDMLKPAYAFGGLSLTQMAKPYVDIWLQTRQSVADLIHSFSVMVLMTDLSTIIQPGNVGALLTRAAMFNMLRDNNGLYVVNKNTEDFKNVSASLSGLHELQAQSQEHMACLPAGTLIETERGQVPIERVKLEDRVLTREGFSSLKWVGVTGQSDTLVQIKGDGFEISATRYHPIWSETDQDFVAAESVSTSHSLRRNTNQENTGHLSHGEADGGGKPTLDITETKRRAACFIASCGNRIADQFRKDTKSTTGMMTGPTTIGIISKFSPGPIISRGIHAAMSASSLWLARLAGMSSRALSLELCFARDPAKQSHAKSDMGGSQHPTRVIAKTAESYSRQKGVTPGSAPAHACSAAVLSVSEIKVPLQPVYNLEVDGLPEFFANGVLVHNSVHRIPLVKFTGIQPSGLNASSEGEIKVYDDTIMAYQSRFMAPNLTRVINFEQLSLFGEVDPEITFRFAPLREMTQAEKGQKEKDDAERNQKYVDMGAIAPGEVRKIIIEDPDLPFTGLDPDDVPDLMSEEMGGLEPPGGHPQEKPDGGGDPSGAEDAGWNESDHPRAPDGKFGSGGSEASQGEHDTEDPSLVAVPMSKNTPEYSKAVVEAYINKGYEPDVKTLPVGKLRATQKELNAPDEDTSEKGSMFKKYSDKPVVVRENGTGILHIVDGHNRISAAVRARRPIDGYIFEEADVGSDVLEHLRKKHSKGGEANDAAVPFAEDEARFEESKHPRDDDGKFASGGGGGGGSSGGEATEPPAEQNTFKTKKEQMGHLLTKGTTPKEVMAALGWPSVSMPQQAASLYMKLEKFKEDGVTKYRGIPMTPAEKSEAQAAALAKRKAKNPGAGNGLRGRAAADPNTWSLFEFLASKGGLKPTADLHSIFGSKRGPFVPGFGPLLRPGGIPMDEALTLAKENAYVIDQNDIQHVPGAIGGGENGKRENTVQANDLQDMIAEESRGKKQYRTDHTAPEAEVNSEEEARHIVDALHREVQATGGTVDPDLEDRVVQIMQKEGESDVLAAYERAIMEDHDKYEGSRDDRKAAGYESEDWDVYPDSASEYGDPPPDEWREGGVPF